jgi:hypothetical protein
MLAKTTLSLAAAVALGSALVAVPSFAQNAPSSQSYKYPVGRSLNDGGFAASGQSLPQNGAARTGAAANQQAHGVTNAPGRNAYAQTYHYPLGRSLNDGGFAMQQER